MSRRLLRLEIPVFPDRRMFRIHDATDDPDALRTAQAGGDFLATSVDEVSDAGLYTGLAGMATVLQLVAEGGGSGRHADAARRALVKVRAAA